MTCKKPIIIAMIEQGYDNAEISRALCTSNSNVSNVRVEYNQAAARPIPSRVAKPKQGTQSRKVYEFIKANPNASNKTTVEATGVNSGTCSKVRQRYFEGRSRERLPPPVVAHSVSLNELALVP